MMGVDWRALLPCPFCGGPAKVLTSEAYHKGSGIASSSCVVCTRASCGAGGPVVEPRTEEMSVEVAERIAIAKWNRRGSHQNTEWKLHRIAAILNSQFGGVREAEAPPTIEAGK